MFASTLRQNIIFGEPFDRRHYRRVVKACALEQDFSMFPLGDKTLVGERGVTLSGGQKARINLARFVAFICKLLLHKAENLPANQSKCQ